MYRLIKPSDELYHYGVKGMKWGVRRYQNYDGTRIGTGGKPMINAGKQAGHRLSNGRNTIAGGQGGKAKGPARLAATVSKVNLASSASGANSGSNESKETSDKEAPKKGMFDKSIKQGKGREDISPAEQINKNFKSGTESAKKATDTIAKYDPKVKKAGEKAAKEAKNMSDKELRDKINRIKMEREYQSLAESEVKSGWTKAGEILEVVGDVASITLAVLGIVATIRSLKHNGLDYADSESELKSLLDLGDYDDDFIAHALDLDSEYIEDYLEHHGVKGMKWGVRRYQNYDGTRIGTGGGGGGGTATRSAGPSKKRSLKDYAYVEAYRDKNNKVGLRFTSDGPKPFKIPPKKTVASGGGPKLAAKSPNSSTSKSVGDAFKDTMNEQKELGKAVKDAITRPLDERRANADAAHKKAINAVKSGLDKAVKDGHVEASSNLLTSYKQKRLVKEAQKMPSNIPQIAKKSHLVSEKTLRDLGNKRRVLDDAIIDGSDDLIKVDNYDIAYTRRSLKWSEKDLKENHPDQYKQIVRDAKAGNYDPIEHKLVERNSAAYKEIEKYSPPETEKTRAIYKAHKDYHNACKKATQDLVGDYGKEIITSNDGGWKSKDVEYLVSAWLEGSAMDRSDQIYRARNR